MIALVRQVDHVFRVRQSLKDELEAVLNLTRTFGECGKAGAGLNDFSSNDVVGLATGRICASSIGRAAVEACVESGIEVAKEIRMVEEIEEVEAGTEGAISLPIDASSCRLKTPLLGHMSNVLAENDHLI